MSQCQNGLTSSAPPLLIASIEMSPCFIVLVFRNILHSWSYLVNFTHIDSSVGTGPCFDGISIGEFEKDFRRVFSRLR